MSMSIQRRPVTSTASSPPARASDANTAPASPSRRSGVIASNRPRRAPEDARVERVPRVERLAEIDDAAVADARPRRLVRARIAGRRAIDRETAAAVGAGDERADESGFDEMVAHRQHETAVTRHRMPRSPN